VLFVHLIQANPWNMLTHQDARTNKQVIEMLIDDAAQEMLAEVSHFGIFVDDERAACLHYALPDRLPVIRENAAQIDHGESMSALLPKIIGRAHAERQGPAITNDGCVSPFTGECGNAERDDILFDVRPTWLPMTPVTDWSVDHVLQQIPIVRLAGYELDAANTKEGLGEEHHNGVWIDDGREH